MQNSLKKPLCILSLTLLSLALAGCQTAAAPPQATPTVTLMPATPTFSPPTATSMPTVTPTATAEPIPSAALEDLDGLELSLLHPWINESEVAFTSLVENFNTNNAWGLRIIPGTAGSLSALADALAEEIGRAHV